MFDHKARRIDETWDIQMFGLVTPERTVKVLEDGECSELRFSQVNH